MNVRWQSFGLDQEYRLLREKLIVGLLKKNFFNNNAYGEYHGYLLRFEASGWGKRTVRILDIEGKKVLGTIAFRYFPYAASIRYEDETYQWQYQPWSQSRWTVTQADEVATYEAGRGWTRGGTGTIDYEYLPPAVVLSGLYVRSYFRRRLWLAIIVLCMVPWLGLLL
ncbi:hypothetical protein HNQ92_002882 [Rhabdobacter roseus]|uniref:Uncharacterized protein n=1 Tax=Rhabdobacter roseus TaxID=1655419 RepID=A0A840TMX5_9BACT|nr:hypothetical protein [Rhabdobacter roseus]MBB5284734.1 hypothetical protein [Rhabdobacter roseus]